MFSKLKLLGVTFCALIAINDEQMNDTPVSQREDNPHSTTNAKELLERGIKEGGKRKGGAMKTDDTYPCMATRSDILTRRCPNRRATGLTKLSGDSASPSRDQTVFSNS